MQEKDLHVCKTPPATKNFKDLSIEEFATMAHQDLLELSGDILIIDRLDEYIKRTKKKTEVGSLYALFEEFCNASAVNNVDARRKLQVVFLLFIFF